jgi:hypothetical protein
MNTLILQFKKAWVTVYALGSLALLPNAQAVNQPNTPDPGPLPISNTADGQLALAGLAGGIYNSAFGIYACLSNGAASFNTGVGAGVLLANTASENTGVGAGVLFSNTTGTHNDGFGTFALFSNTEGSDNTAVGNRALLFNADGVRHTAVGSGALQNCIAAPDFAGNTAVGTQALFNDTEGNFNTAVGDAALKTNTLGAVNTAIGLDALGFNTEGSTNTAVGGNALFTNSTGNNNTAVGIFALFSNDTGNLNIAVGRNAGVNQDTGSNNIYIGDAGVAGESNVIAIGSIASSDIAYTDFFAGGVFGAAVDAGTAVTVLVDSAGKLGTVPVAAAPGRQGARHQAMRNESVHSKFEELQATVAQQQKEIALLTAQLKEQASQIQKVSAQLQLNKSAPQTVLNDR